MSENNKPSATMNASSMPSELHGFNALYQKLSGHIERARESIQRSIDTEMVKAYWLIGRDIVEEEQQGQARANYGKAIIKGASQQLASKYGRGFSEANVIPRAAIICVF